MLSYKIKSLTLIYKNRALGNFLLLKEKLKLTATNTHRLSVTSTAVDAKIEGKNYFVVPAKTLKEIATMFS